MRVHERGQRVQALGLDDLGALGRLERAGGAQLGDHAAADEHVVRGVEARPRVEHVRGADEQVGGRLLAGGPADPSAAHAATTPRTEPQPA